MKSHHHQFTTYIPIDIEALATAGDPTADLHDNHRIRPNYQTVISKPHQPIAFRRQQPSLKTKTNTNHLDSYSCCHNSNHPTDTRGNHNSNATFSNNSNGRAFIEEEEAEAAQTGEAGGKTEAITGGQYQSSTMMMMTSNTNEDLFNTTNTNTNSNTNTDMSLVSIALQRRLDATIKSFSKGNSTGEDKENSPASFLVSAQLQTKNDACDGKWGVLVHGDDYEAVEAVKREVMRSTPKLLSPGLKIEDEGDECEFENVSLFDEEEEEEEMSASVAMSKGETTKSAIMSSSTTCCSFNSKLHHNLLLGPKHHMVMKLLRESDCTVTIADAHLLTLSDERGHQILTARQERLLDAALHEATILIPADKIDWMWLSGKWKRLEETLWRNGASLVECGKDCYRLTALSAALLNKCMDTIQEYCTAHQTISLVFKCRDDLRDYPAELQTSLQTAAHSLGCTIKHSPHPDHCQMHVEIGGEAGDIARMAIRLQSMPLSSPDVHLMERKMSIQVPAEIKDFLCGKKDGKLMRIMKETGVLIKLQECPGTESLFVELVETVMPGRQSQLPMAGQLLQGELPAQLSFHVPETHHKRMIGHGGKAIQKIMKKWGVYVKFLNSFEASQLYNYADPFEAQTRSSSPALSGPIDNVIVKTPGKNAAALHAIKEEIFALDEADGGVSLASLQRRPLCRASIPNASLESVKRFIASSANRHSAAVECSLQERTVWLESSSKSALQAAIDFLASASGSGRVVTRSPTLSSVSEDAFKHFPSALFVQSHASLSASGSPLLSEERSLLNTSSNSSSWENIASQLEYPESASAAASPSLTSSNTNTNTSTYSPTPSNTSSVAMNSVSGSPSLLPVGSKDSLGQDDEVEVMIANLANKRQFWHM